jgi:hypothetical protein
MQPKHLVLRLRNKGGPGDMAMQLLQYKNQMKRIKDPRSCLKELKAVERLLASSMP